MHQNIAEHYKVLNLLSTLHQAHMTDYIDSDHIHFKNQTGQKLTLAKT